MLNSNTIISLNSAVDVYKIGDDQLEFYFITTRQRITMNVTSSVVTLVNNIDGETCIGSICDNIGLNWQDEDVQAFLQYLLNKKVFVIPLEEKEKRNLLSENDIERYDRQLYYFNSFAKESAFEFQKELQESKILIFGVGAIGSGIALQLVMAGVRNLIIVDKDIVSEDSIERHFTFRHSDIGKPKVDALSCYLKEIDSSVKCENHYQIVDFDTSIDEWLDKSDFVINTLDEPYIGFTSMKIGRACYQRNIPLYVAGGFDAHLMSTGELIVPNITPCVDCYTSYFTESLENWKPTYNVNAIPESEIKTNIFEVGGLASMSLFSISYAVIVILNFIATGEPYCSKGRGELLFDDININYLNVPKNPNCHVCGNK